MEKFNNPFKDIDLNEVLNKVINWAFSLSSRSLELTAIVVLHCMFLPATMAYLNAITDQLPSLDTYLLALGGLLVLFLRAIINNDRVANLIHMSGLAAQLVVIAMILLK